MLKRPKKCCAMGSYECQVPMPLNGRRQDVDLCIADIVAALNAANIITMASCCGHGEQEGIINLEDGRELKFGMSQFKVVSMTNRNAQKQKQLTAARKWDIVI